MDAAGRGPADGRVLRRRRDRDRREHVVPPPGQGLVDRPVRAAPRRPSKRAAATSPAAAFETFRSSGQTPGPADLGHALMGLQPRTVRLLHDGPRPFSAAEKALIRKVHGYMPAQQLLEVLNERLAADLGPDETPHTMEQLYAEIGETDAA